MVDLIFLRNRKAACNTAPVGGNTQPSTQIGHLIFYIFAIWKFSLFEPKNQHVWSMLSGILYFHDYGEEFHN